LVIVVDEEVVDNEVEKPVEGSEAEEAMLSALLWLLGVMMWWWGVGWW
jgi:hypothetical protein